MDDRAGKATDQREAFGLQNFLGVMMIEIAHAQTEFLHQTDGQTRRTRQDFEQVVAQDEIDLGVDFGRRRR